MRSLLGRFHRPFARSADEQLLLMNNLGDGSTLSLDFTSGVLDPRLTFTRGSNATFINSSGLVEFAGQNVLVQTANMTLWSGPTNIDTTVWGSQSDPFGGTTATRLTPTTANATHNLQSALVSSATLGSGLRTVYSVYAKARTSRYRFFGMVVNASNAQASFVLTGAGEGTATALFGTGVTASMTSVGGGWYRCEMTWPSSITSASCWCAVLQNNSTVPSGQSFSGQADDVSGGHGIDVYGAQWEQGSTPHTFIPTTGVAKSDIPRFDYDPTTIGSPRGLLIEGSTSNALIWSEAFTSGGTWGYNATTPTTESSHVNPTGNTGGISFAPSSAGGSRYLGAFTTGNTTTAFQTFSIWLKAKGTSTCVVICANSAGNVNSNMTIISQPSGASASVTGNGGVAPTISNLSASGWTRVSVTTAAALGGTGAFNVFMYPNATSGQTTADSLYVWGAQLETGSGASSYIPTGASTGSRNSDSCSIPMSAFGFVTTGGTFQVNYRRGEFGSTNERMAISTDYAAGKWIGAFHNSGSNSAVLGWWDGVGNLTRTTQTAGANKLAYSFGANTGSGATLQLPVSLSVNGSTTSGTFGNGTSNGANVPNLANITYLVIGAASSSTAAPAYSTANRDFLNNCVSLVKYWPTRLPDAQLTILST